MRALFLVAALFMTACTETQSGEPEAPEASALQLSGTRWAMLEANAADPRAGVPTIEFGAAGRASGYSGCNQWFAQVDTADGLSFGGVGMTRRACPGPAMETERSFGAMLAATRNARVDGDTLMLLGANGEQLGILTRTR
jgi:heat shock protein HslJ